MVSVLVLVTPAGYKGELTVTPKALGHGQQAAPGLWFGLLGDGWQGDGDGVHAAKSPRTAGRLAA